jgi:hypothetical protein
VWSGEGIRKSGKGMPGTGLTEGFPVILERPPIPRIPIFDMKGGLVYVKRGLLGRNTPNGSGEKEERR